jgi:hypothetical protein
MMMLLFISSVPEVTFSQYSCKKVRERERVCLRPNFIVHIHSKTPYSFKNATERLTQHALITHEREREREERENHN